MQNLGHANKPLPVTCERVVSPFAVMGLKGNDGATALFLIARGDVEAWKETYGGYVEIPFDDYTEFFPYVARNDVIHVEVTR